MSPLRWYRGLTGKAKTFADTSAAAYLVRFANQTSTRQIIDEVELLAIAVHAEWPVGEVPGVSIFFLVADSANSWLWTKHGHSRQWEGLQLLRAIYRFLGRCGGRLRGHMPEHTEMKRGMSTRDSLAAIQDWADRPGFTYVALSERRNEYAADTAL